MPVLNIKPYEPTYIGKPVEAISNMLKTLDSNNERITDSYRTINSTLSQLPVGDNDRGLITKYKSDIDSKLDEALKSDDYGNIATVIKGGYDNIVNSPEINAAVVRNKQYEEYRKNIADLYYSGKGDISKEQYDYYINKELPQTLPDENGVFNQKLNIPTPARAVDFGQFAQKVLSTIMDDGSSGTVNNYLTNEEVSKLLNQPLGNLDPKGLSSFKKASNYVTSRGVSRDKRRKVLKDAIATNVDLNAYIDDLVKIDNEKGGTQTKADMLNAMMEPYVNGAGYITSQQELNDDSRFLYQQRMMNERATNNKTFKNENGEDEPLFVGEQRDLIGSINIDPGITQLTDQLETSYDWNNLTSNYSNLRFDKNLPNYKAERFIDNVAQAKYNRGFNELNIRERKALIEELNTKKEYTDQQTSIVNRPYTDKGAKAKTVELFGDDIINFKDGSNVNGTASHRALYNVQTGEVIEAGKVNDYLKEIYKEKKPNVRVIGELEGDNPVVEATGNLQFMNGTTVKIGGDTYISAGSYYDNSGQINEQIADVFKKVENGKYATRSIQSPIPEQQVAGKPVSYEMEVSKVYTNDGTPKMVLQTNSSGDETAANGILKPQRFEASDSESLTMQYLQWVNEVQALHSTVGTKDQMNYKTRLNNTSK